jgi:hypothetical protein
MRSSSNARGLLGLAAVAGATDGDHADGSLLRIAARRRRYCMAEDAPSEDETALPPDIEQRVGRNLLPYQRIENALKLMLLVSMSEGTPSDHEQRATARVAKVMRLNMGDAVGAVFDQVLTAEPRAQPAKHDPNEIWVRMTITIGPPADRPGDFEALRERCKAVVDQRNDLVHHFLRQASYEAGGDMAAVINALDAQHNVALALRGELLGYLNSLKAFRQEHAAYFNSEPGRSDFAFAVAQGAVIDALVEVAQQTRRTEGWEHVTTALHRLSAGGSPFPDVKALKERWGKEWVKRLFDSASDGFEVTDEPLPNAAPGTTRKIYRLRKA